MGRTIFVIASGLLSVTLTLTGGTLAQETTDQGTLDKETATKLFPKAGYSPYAGRTYPTPPIFW